jgi:alkanesulfonate monooxygenase SsuD/methylene tetrahydromethanopterin reductase-like flavin-dependent oxidoreductase (luciferase family)
LAKPKFGVFLPFYAFPKDKPTQKFQQLKNLVLECERLGYDSVWLDDHLMFEEWPILEPWTALSALAALTSKIRLGTMVTCSAHHHPALLAKKAATFDIVSNGRLEFGIGAGCQKAEHVAYGFGFDSASLRINRLGEALEVLTLLWTQKKASYTGKYFTLKEAVCEPKPLQQPHPPVIVGGSGEKTLKVTAKYADRYDFGYLPTVEDYKQKLNILQKQCNSIGRSFNEIERSCWPSGQILIAQNRRELNEKISQHKPEGTPLEEYRRGTLAGTPDECLEQLRIFRGLDVAYFMLYFADLPSLDGLRLFSEAVAKQLA